MKNKCLFTFIMAIIVMFSICTTLPMKISVPLKTNVAYENTHTNTGNQRADIVAIAQTQVGYHEGSLEGTTNGSDNYTKYNKELYAIEGSYKYMWCQSFIAWCAKQAGVPSDVIKRTAGTVDAMDFFKAQGVWQGRDYTPQSGDIIYFTSSSSNSGYHVGIVESVSGSTINTIERNYSDKVGRHSVTMGSLSIVGYGVPNYVVPDPYPPEPPALSINRNSGTSNDIISITWNAAKYADSYWLHIYRDGADYVNQTLNQDLSYSAKYPAGNYTAYVVSCNSQGEALSSVDFFICDSNPEKPAPYIEKKSYSINETVTITWNKTQLTDSYWLHIYRNGEDYINQTLNQDLSYSATYPVGNYTAFIVSCNGVGETLSSVEFSIYDTKPDAPKLNINKTLFTSEETVSLSWSAVANTTHYWLLIMRDGVQYKSQSLAQALTCSEKFPAGKYEVAISAVNQYGYTAGIVFFTVYDSKPDAPKINIEKTEFSPNELIKISWEEVPNATYYWINISKNGESYISQQAETLSYEAQLPNGSYDVAISAANPYGYSVENASFHIGISGDLNDDGDFNISDAVILQKWLLGMSNTKLNNWKAADLCEDNRIDVFDMIEMRKLIINSQSAQ